MNDGPVLVTGVAGFIGMHVARALLERGDRVVGIDNFDPYYDVGLKHARLQNLLGHPRFEFAELDVVDEDNLSDLMQKHRVDRVVHLAAQAGVRHSIDHPHSYGRTNLTGFLSVLEACRHRTTTHLVYASSSSVYGATGGAQSEDLRADLPVSLYAATKRANELMAHSYSHLYGMPTTGLRFFTVYGPWGRPDMAPYLFTDSIANGRPIHLHNNGRMLRDFTYIDDIVSGVLATLDRPPVVNRFDTGAAPYRIFNVGNSDPVDLNRFVTAIETALGRKAIRVPTPMPAGDVPSTSADVTRLTEWCGYRPSTSIEDGIRRFVDWYVDHHQRSTLGEDRGSFIGQEVELLAS